MPRIAGRASLFDGAKHARTTRLRQRARTESAPSLRHWDKQTLEKHSVQLHWIGREQAQGTMRSGRQARAGPEEREGGPRISGPAASECTVRESLI